MNTSTPPTMILRVRRRWWTDHATRVTLVLLPRVARVSPRFAEWCADTIAVAIGRYGYAITTVSR